MLGLSFGASLAMPMGEDRRQLTPGKNTTKLVVLSSLETSAYEYWEVRKPPPMCLPSPSTHTRLHTPRARAGEVG